MKTHTAGFTRAELWFSLCQAHFTGSELTKRLKIQLATTDSFAI